MQEAAQLNQRVSSMRESLAAATINGLARWTPYVESEIQGLRELVHPGDVCLDIGAAAGLYTMVLSQLAGPSGRVHSVEPLPFANLVLARLLNASRATNVCRHAVALGAERGVDIMHVPIGRFGFVTGRSFLGRSAAGPDPNVEFDDQVAVSVTVDTLDALCAREAIAKLRFVKIDVEGAELQVLEGGKQLIADARPTMLIEIEARHTARYGHTPADVISWMLDRGYTMHVWEHGWRPAGSIESSTRNYLFRPSSTSRCSPRSRRERLPAIAV
jgi:FkbM family methyltransferase